MKTFEIKHRCIGELDQRPSITEIDADTKEDALHIFYNDWVDLPYFIVSCEEIDEEEIAA